MIRPAYALLLLTLAPACATTTPGTSWETTARNEAAYDARYAAPRANDAALVAAASRVRVMQTGDLGCKMQSLGLVDVHEPMKTEEAALDLLKRRAAALGAEGIMGVEFHHGEAGNEPTHLSGIAVKCNDLLKGRTYTVIEKMDIAGAMGEEDEAYDKMRVHAFQELHADLIIDISFEHGEGANAKTHVFGTAIKLR